MKLNTDLTKKVNAFFEQSRWSSSPIKEVKRKMLERDGGEIAIATTIVRYEPNSYFTSHIHDGGEEFLVLDGEFADEHGRYPIGTYMRNPPGTSHTPSVEPGCMILVKLGQFQEGDTQPVHIDTQQHLFVKDEARTGVAIQPLHSFKHEVVRLERWEQDSTIMLENTGGIEILVIEGAYDHDGVHYTKHDWLRLPIGEKLNAKAGHTGCIVWIKTGHHFHQLNHAAVSGGIL
ncbi:anti-sigma factor [Photobacterium frigidiphilum]|uniref:Anti-sigma factor n=1 Tax=Photobacterium frigidiphilum TaxID=264736 RepID=A0A2T3J8W3_9GAMM|nr:cupin domain-containing protein [Photobacterium frigidiphilum]PSU45196.1 anti-sigma factor [Photobacterium frigidiphilum]